MTVERGMAPRDFGPAYRGQHGDDGGQWGGLGARTPLVLLVTAIVVLAVVAAAAVFVTRPSGRSRLLPPIQAVAPPPALGPVPTPSTVPSPPGPPGEPPGFPSSIPTADPASPSVVPTTGPPGPPQAAPQPRRTRPPIRTINIEAESSANTLSGETRIRALAGASGGQVIGWIGTRPANTLRFNRVVVPARGIYTLTVFYVSGIDRVAAVRADGGVPVELTFPGTGDFRTVGALTVRVEFRAGVNTLEIGNPRDRAPDIDRIRVSN